MKRIITLFLAFLLAAMVAACAGSSDSVTGKNTQNENSTQSPTVDISESEPPAETEKQTESSGAAQGPETEEQRILVVYFSCTGNTAPLAEYVAEITGAGLYEITAEVPYTDDDIAYQISGCRANTEQKDAACRPAISGTVVDIQNYDVIFVAFPIWWGEEPRIIDTFMESYDFSGKDYLGLEVVFAPLSPDGSVCGLTTYTDTRFTVEENGVIHCFLLKKNQIVLDKSSIQPEQVKRLCGKRRFTLAHECAHQILFQLESDEMKARWKDAYSTRKAYSLRDLKSKEDWNEWQANVLGAALLMPQRETNLAMEKFTGGRILQNYEGRFPYLDQQALEFICRTFGVSKSAAIIRLRELGHLKDHPYFEFYDPVKIRRA